MNFIIFLISSRYLFGAQKEKNISTMVIVCFLGVMISSFVLALVTCIMNGFETATHEKLQGIHAQIIMRSSGSESLDAPKISHILQTEFPQVAASSPSTFRQVLIKEQDCQECINAVLVKAINPDDEKKISTIATKIKKSLPNTNDLAQLLNTNSILIGDKLAQSLSVKPGDTVTLLYIPEQPGTKHALRLLEKTVLISGTFSTGIDEFDSNLILMSLALLKQLFPDSGVTQFNIQLHSHADEQKTIDALKARFGLDVFSWKELYPALVSALKLEKYAMFFILALITFVALMTIIALMFMQIVQKRADIAIYQAMGMHKKNITTLFMVMGVSLCALASLAGLLLAFSAGTILERYPFITLPDTYYVSHLPIQMNYHIFLITFIVVICMGTLASWLPCRTIRSYNAAALLRYER